MARAELRFAVCLCIALAAASARAEPVQAVRGLGQPAGQATGPSASPAARIAEAKKCIDFSQRQIDAENEIGRTVGYVNKTAIYQAGRNLVVCRQDLKRYQSEAAALKSAR